MTEKQTYQTRVLTAQDHRLIDALEKDPRYSRLAAQLRPPGSAAPKRPKASENPGPIPPGHGGDPVPKPDQPPPSPQPEPEPEPSSHRVGAMGRESKPDPSGPAKPAPKGKGG
jgi:hypothetical protein